MPTFTFEKISSVVRMPVGGPTMAVTPPVTKPRGVIIQLLDRLTAAKMRREGQLGVSFTEHDIGKPPR